MTPEDLLTEVTTVWFDGKLWRAKGRELQYTNDWGETDRWHDDNTMETPKRFGDIIALGRGHGDLVVITEFAMFSVNVCEDHGPHMELVAELKPCLKG